MTKNVDWIDDLDNAADSLADTGAQILKTLPGCCAKRLANAIDRGAADTEIRHRPVWICRLRMGNRGDSYHHRIAVALQFDIEGGADRLGRDLTDQIVAGGDWGASNGHDDIAWQDASCVGRRARQIAARLDNACDPNKPLLLVRTPGCVHHRDQHNRNDHVHDRTGSDDPHAARVGGRPIREALVLGRDFVQIVHADDANKCTKRNRTKPVFDVVSMKAPDSRTEANEELSHLHATATSGPIVTRLVQQHGHKHADHKGHHPPTDNRKQHEQGGPRNQTDDGHDRIGSFVLGILVS